MTLPYISSAFKLSLELKFRPAGNLRISDVVAIEELLYTLEIGVALVFGCISKPSEKYEQKELISNVF